MNELIVSSGDNGLRIGLLEDNKIVELHRERPGKRFSVGDIFLGRVKKIVPGLNAAFVNVGHSKDAFLHYFDLGPQVQSMNHFVKSVRNKNRNYNGLDGAKLFPDIDKSGKISNVLKQNQLILVQIDKEAISTKGPRLSSEISIPGKYIILTPFLDEVSISRKMKSGDEKKRLKILAESIKPKNFGMIIRTAAEGKDVKTLDMDLQDLLKKWESMCNAIVKARPPQKVLKEEDRTTSILRDMLSIGFDRIITDDKDVYEEVGNFLPKNAEKSAIRLYKGKAPLFHHLGIERQIKGSFGKTVTISSGAYLIIEHTEAMHVIDVNSGSKNLQGNTLEENALKTNMAAASEIARQLRLRDMGGIIVIDFIDLRKAENKRQLYAHFKTEMQKDRAKHTILPMSKFGLVQITRQRVRPELNIVTEESCPCCNGSGKIQASILLTDEINNNVDFLMRQNKEKSLKVMVHPFVEAYLKKGFPHQVMKWRLKYGRKVTVQPDVTLPLMTVKYYNSKGETIHF